MERAVFQNAVSPLYLEHIYYSKDKRRLKVREYHIFNVILLTNVIESIASRCAMKYLDRSLSAFCNPSPPRQRLVLGLPHFVSETASFLWL